MDTEGCSASAAAASTETVEQPKSTTPAKAAFMLQSVVWTMIAQKAT